MRDALAEQTAHLPAALRRTLTWDQGRELYLHEEIEDLTGFRIYFCDPHSPWQRGTNENTNGLLREYFPEPAEPQFRGLFRLRGEGGERGRCGMRCVRHPERGSATKA